MASYNQMPEDVLQDRARAALARLKACDICPRRCGADRSSGGEVGFCRSGRKARVACFAPHFGEEASLVGRSGSGTIFFSGCNLACVFCQKHGITNGTIREKPINFFADGQPRLSVVSHRHHDSRVM